MFKTGALEISSDVRSKPLGQKRKRGRPKKLPACLTRSPEPNVVADIPTALYHPPSPNISLISSLLTSPPPSSPQIEVPTVSDSSQLHTFPILTQSSVTKKRGRNIIDENIDENTDVVEEIPLLPPAKKKSRLGLTYCENITNIDKRVTRLSKRNKK